MELILPSPGTTSPRLTFKMPLGPSRAAIPFVTSRTLHPSIVVGLVSGTGVGFVPLSVSFPLTVSGLYSAASQTNAKSLMNLLEQPLPATASDGCSLMRKGVPSPPPRWPPQKPHELRSQAAQSDLPWN